MYRRLNSCTERRIQGAVELAGSILTTYERQLFEDSLTALARGSARPEVEALRVRRLLTKVQQSSHHVFEALEKEVVDLLGETARGSK